MEILPVLGRFIDIFSILHFTCSGSVKRVLCVATVCFMVMGSPSVFAQVQSSGTHSIADSTRVPVLLPVHPDSGGTELPLSTRHTGEGVFASVGYFKGGWRFEENGSWNSGLGMFYKAGYRKGGLSFFGGYSAADISYPGTSSATMEIYEAGVSMLFDNVGLGFHPHVDFSAGLLFTNKALITSRAEVGGLITVGLGFTWLPVKWAGLFADAQIGGTPDKESEDEDEPEMTPEERRARKEIYRFTYGLRLYF